MPGQRLGLLIRQKAHQQLEGHLAEVLGRVGHSADLRQPGDGRMMLLRRGHARRQRYIHGLVAHHLIDVVPVEAPHHVARVIQRLALEQVVAGLVGMESVAVQEDRHRGQATAYRPQHEVRTAGELHPLGQPQVHLGLHLVGQLADGQPVAVLAANHILGDPNPLLAHAFMAGETRQRLGEARLQLAVDPGVAGERAQPLLVLHPLVPPLHDLLEHLQGQRLAGALHAVGVAVLQQAAVAAVHRL